MTPFWVFQTLFSVLFCVLGVLCFTMALFVGCG